MIKKLVLPGRPGLAALTLLLAGLFASGNAQAIIVDTFDDGQDILISGVIPGPSNTASADAIGGSRTLSLLGGSGITLAVDGAGGTPDNVLSHSQLSGTSGSSQVTWDANGALLGGADLTDAGINDALQLDILSIDQGAVTLTFNVTDTGGATSSLALSNLGVGQFAFLFTDFTGGANFASVDSVNLQIDASTAADLTLDLVQTRKGVITAVPLPGSLPLLGLGLLGLLIAHRRAPERTPHNKNPLNKSPPYSGGDFASRYAV